MNSFEIVELPGKGRGMIAKKKFDIGDVIFEEEPFVSHQFSWNAAYGYRSCDHCMRPLESTLESVKRLTNNKVKVLPLKEYDPTAKWLEQHISCPSCKVCYCCEDCRIVALKQYHKAACMGNFRHDESHPINVLNEVWKKMHYPPETSTIMLLVRLMAMYQQSNNKPKFLENLESFQSFACNAEQKICHKMLGEHFEEQINLLFKSFSIAFIDEHFKLFTTSDTFKSLLALMGTNSQGIATSVLAEWVRNVTDLPMSTEEKVELDRYIDDVYNQVSEFSGEFLNNEGIGLYFFQSKINHSCIPNAHSTFPYSNDIVVLKAIAPIQIGEEICISYIEECQLERSRHSRQKILKENYIFLCDCGKCQMQVNDLDESSEDEDIEEMDTSDTLE